MSPGKGIWGVFTVARSINLEEIRFRYPYTLDAAWDIVYLHIDGAGHRLNKSLTIQEALYTVQAWARSQALRRCV